MTPRSTVGRPKGRLNATGFADEARLRLLDIRASIIHEAEIAQREHRAVMCRLAGLHQDVTACATQLGMAEALTDQDARLEAAS